MLPKIKALDDIVNIWQPLEFQQLEWTNEEEEIWEKKGEGQC